jgi:hypothetical protein
VIDSSALPLLMRDDYALVRGIRLAWDSVANTWNQHVLGYTPDRQRALMTRVGLDDATWRTLSVLMVVIGGAVTLILGLLTLQRIRVRVRDPVKLTYTSFCRKLAQAGLARAPSEGPLSYAERVIGVRPDLEPLVRRFVALYVNVRYGTAADAQTIAELRALARDFKA